MDTKQVKKICLHKINALILIVIFFFFKDRNLNITQFKNSIYIIYLYYSYMNYLQLYTILKKGNVLINARYNCIYITVKKKKLELSIVLLIEKKTTSVRSILCVCVYVYMHVFIYVCVLLRIYKVESMRPRLYKRKIFH